MASRIAKGAGWVVLLASLWFILDRLWKLDWISLRIHFSWTLIGAGFVACILFAAADCALASAWTRVADPDRKVSWRELTRIYGWGALMKYLPGSVFQYIGRQAGGAKAGLPHSGLAYSTIIEIALHIASSLAIAGAAFYFDKAEWVVVPLFAFVAISMMSRRPIGAALGFQLLAFLGFALAAGIVSMAVPVTGVAPGKFASMFLMAWLAGFVIPVAPGGLGVREAMLIALAGNSAAAPLIIAATLVLRIASIAGDLIFGLSAIAGAPLAWPRTTKSV